MGKETDDLVDCIVRLSEARREMKGLNPEDNFCDEETVELMKKVIDLYKEHKKLDVKDLYSYLENIPLKEIDKHWKDKYSKTKKTRDIRRLLYFMVDLRLLNLIERNVKKDAKIKFEINWEYTPDRFEKMLEKHDIDK